MVINMKTNRGILLSLAISSACSVNAAEIFNKDGNQLALYGKIEVRNQSGKNGQSGDDSRVRLGLKGTSEISDGFYGFGHFEWETKTNKNEEDSNSKNRLVYAGFRLDDVGSVDYGRNYGVLYDIGGWTDVLPIYWDSGMYKADNYMTSRNRGLLTLRHSDLFGYAQGLNVAIQYQGDNDNDDISASKDSLKNNGKGLGISLFYDTDLGLSVGGGYANSRTAKPGLAESYATGKNAEAWNIGAKYNANNLYLAATYGQTRNMTSFGSKIHNVAPKTDTVEVVAQYLFDFGLKPSIAYMQTKARSVGRYGDNDLNKYISLGSFYYFTDDFFAMVDYKINFLEDNEFTRFYGIKKDNVFAVGLTYRF